MSKGLTKATIIEAAFGLLDRVGIDGVTVRALAAELGVKAPALYWHFTSKQDLLDEMGTEVTRRVLRAFDLAPAELSLSGALRAYAVALRTEFARHRDGARTFSGTRITEPDLLRQQEGLLARWVDRGAAVERVVEGYEVVTAYVIGFVIEEQERAQAEPGRYSIERRDADLGQDHPLAVAAGHAMAVPPDQRFARHLELIIPALVAPTDAE